MRYPEFPAPLFSDADDHLTCLCGAVLIQDFWRLAAEAPGVLQGANVRCYRCAGIGQASLGGEPPDSDHPGTS